MDHGQSNGTKIRRETDQGQRSTTDKKGKNNGTKFRSALNQVVEAQQIKVEANTQRKTEAQQIRADVNAQKTRSRQIKSKANT